MRIGDLIAWSFIAGMLLSMIGAYFKIMHFDGADAMLAIGLVATLVYIATAIYEVQTSSRIDRREKIMWTISLIFFNGIAGLVYFIFRRKRVVNN